jgi:hypothetical protein
MTNKASKPKSGEGSAGADTATKPGAKDPVAQAAQQIAGLDLRSDCPETFFHGKPDLAVGKM